jgi:predicted membrane metal-binding protein
MSTPETTKVTGWVGWIWFAGLMLVMLGAFNIIQGFAAILTDDVFLPTEEGGVLLDVTGWGWANLIIGLLLLLAGLGLFSGATWARILAVIMVMLNAVAQLASLNYHPAWGIVIIALDVVVIWALIVHGEETQEVQV